MQNQPQQSQKQFRPPLVTAVFVACWIAATVYLLNMGRYFPWATAAAFVAIAMGIGQVIHLFDDIAQLRAYWKRRKAYREAGKDYGETSFGDIDDARQAGLVNKGGR
jgi:predicted RND superfamily exporter protein